MIPELDCLRKNFDVIAESIRNTNRAPARTIAAPSRDVSEETDRGTPNLNDLCEECEHPIRLHGRYGCEYERGDRPGGEGPNGPEPAMAMGPCGCREWEVEEAKSSATCTAEGAATAVVVSQQARANAGAEFKPEAALKSHLEAHDNYLDHISGCNGW